jgi:hypothetical protein
MHPLHAAAGDRVAAEDGEPEHMRSNAEVDFVVSDEDVAALQSLRDVDYGEHSVFPVYSGK